MTVAGGIEQDEFENHWRWLCFCGEVGGWRATTKQARVGLTLHQQYAHEGRVHPRVGKHNTGRRQKMQVREYVDKQVTDAKLLLDTLQTYAHKNDYEAAHEIGGQVREIVEGLNGVLS